MGQNKIGNVHSSIDLYTPPGWCKW